MKDPTEVTNALREKYGYKLKGVGSITYHLGSNYKRDPDGTFQTSAESYIEKMVESYERTFGVTPKGFSSPLEKNDHPELDSSEITLFQSHIGCLQWCVTLGRFDIATAVMTMSRDRVSPRKGHLKRSKRMIGYLRKCKLGSIRVRTSIPDYSYLGKSPEYNWMNSVYGDVLEEVPKDAPAPLDKTVMTTTYVDANLYHDWTTGRAVTGTLHFLNGTPIDFRNGRTQSRLQRTDPNLLPQELPPIKLSTSNLLSNTLVFPCRISHTCSVTTKVWSPVQRCHTPS